MNSELDELQFFSSPVYFISALEHLDKVKEVANDPTYYNPNNTLDDNFGKMSADISSDERIHDFCLNVIQSSWNILEHQGYMMSNYHTIFESMWVQNHNKHSHMPYHTHSGGVQLVGFYFLDVPENSSKLIIHDPRIAKTQIDLEEINPKEITLASKMVTFIPKAGDLILINAWLAHSLSSNLSDDTLKFVHINIGTQKIANNPPPAPIII